MLGARFCSVLMLLCCVAGPASAGWNPPGWERSNHAGEASAISPVGVPLAGLLTFYQKFISPVDGANCPSHPTCSTYAKQAFREVGPLAGYALTASRLISEGNEIDFSPMIKVGGTLKIHSPLEEDLRLMRGAH